MARWGFAFRPRELLRTVAAILLAMLGTYLLGRMGALHEFERWALDVELAAARHQTNHVAVVLISDADYDAIFAARSPLDREKLRDLISAVSRSKPAVIAVDIETLDHQFRDLKIDADWPPVIWERDVTAVADIHSGQMEPLDVLGGQDPTLNANSGIPVLLDDSDDKVTRYYTRCVNSKAGPLPTFVSAAAEAYRLGAQRSPPHTRLACDVPDQLEPIFIRYSPEGLRTFHARQILALSDKQENGGQERTIAELAGKLVLIGGNYRDLDRHDTPAGVLPGVLILGHAIETELNGNISKPPPKWLLFLIEFFAGGLVVILLHRLTISPAKALAFGIPAIAVFSIALSLVTFQTFSRFMTFAPTLLALLAFEIYEHVRLHSLLRAFPADSGTHPPNRTRPD